MDIVEAYDLTGSYRAAAELAGCDHQTVARYVQPCEQGERPVGRTRRARPIGPYLEKIEELVAVARGRIRAGIVHRRITAMGFAGVERTTRRTVAEVKSRWRTEHHRVYRPWLPEPALWLQFDWGEGPRLNGRRTSLWCAWLSWSRFRVVIPVFDKTLPTIAACLQSRCHTDHGVCRSNGSLDRVIAGSARHESRAWRYTGKIQGRGRPRAATVGRHELASR